MAHFDITDTPSQGSSISRGEEETAVLDEVDDLGTTSGSDDDVPEHDEKCFSEVLPTASVVCEQQNCACGNEIRALLSALFPEGNEMGKKGSGKSSAKKSEAKKAPPKKVAKAKPSAKHLGKTEKAQIKKAFTKFVDSL
jgi:hypothetical protein